MGPGKKRNYFETRGGKPKGMERNPNKGKGREFLKQCSAP